MESTQPISNMLKWLRTFEGAASVDSVEDIADGLIIANALHKISPKHFTGEWLDTIDAITAAVDWRIKAKNLRRIVEAVVDFLAEFTELRLPAWHLPDVTSIAERNDQTEAYTLLRLILYCAVNCESKEAYIQTIMGMEEPVQRALMVAIQQFPDLSSLDDKERLAQRCHELELKSSLLNEEKLALQLENERLLSLVSASEPAARPPNPIGSMNSDDQGDTLSTSSSLIDPNEDSQRAGNVGSEEALGVAAANIRLRQLQDQLSNLRDELYRTEAAKVELKIKLEETLTANIDLKQKCEKLGQRAGEASQLNDELDILREELAAASRLCSSMDQLRKRADEAVELRNRCAKLEADNKVCTERIAQLEQETRLGGSLRSQAELQRRQASEAQLAATEATRRADNAELELAKLRDELTAANCEKQRVTWELKRLRSCCEDLQQSVQAASSSPSTSVPPGPDVNRLMPVVQSQMINLEHELTRLRASPSSADMANPSNDLDEAGTDGNIASANLSRSISDSEDNIHSLRSQLAERDSRLQQVEQRYRNYLWKAREVIRLLDAQRREALANASPNTSENCEVNKLRELLAEKERIIDKLEQHHEQTRRQRDAEEHLIVTAWYNMGKQMARAGTTARLPDDSVSDHVPLADASFLTKQRQIHLKAPHNSTALVTSTK